MTKRARQQGELEQLILEILWASPTPLTSHEILERANAESALALTTVLTVLSRLVDKGLATRGAGEGRSLLFSAAQTREQHTADLLLKIVSGSSNPALAFSHFAEGLNDTDLAALRQVLDR
jgi:predicted transcriptional regulator